MIPAKLPTNRIRVERRDAPRLSEASAKQGATPKLPDIKPRTEIRELKREGYENVKAVFRLADVAPVVGLAPSFIRRVVGNKSDLNVDDVLKLLDQDAFAETFIQRSRVVEYLLTTDPRRTKTTQVPVKNGFVLKKANALDFVKSLPDASVQCVVTSTPYWALRIYKEPLFADWADGERCPFGHEQTPEGFLRHTAELLYEIGRVMKQDGSVWWNVMDSFNTRTQIRGNAAEALRAMQGKDKRKWTQHQCRRYSAGHSHLKDGEQCLIPSRIAERASRMGYYIKSVITWAKTSTLPEPQETRVSKNLEYVLHLTRSRAPYFKKEIYRELPANLGGRNNGHETDKLSDVWTLPTSAGRDGHGAQFPVALPGRCIALSSKKDDLILDPFVGAGNAGIAAVTLGRQFLGVDVSAEYLSTANRKLEQAMVELNRKPLSRVVQLVESIQN
ncbi:MAG: methylase domain protein [Bradyrhizobium sp.]|nr:methylase domain protein [Bradyrhizobium sp.]